MTSKSAGTKLATSFVAGALLVATAFAPAAAQEPPQMTPEQMAEMEAYMKAGTPGAPHQALASSVGDYDLVIKSWYEPGAPPMEESGTATRTMALDGRVLIEEVSSSMMGMPYTGHLMMGFDNVTEKYWSTWTDSMSTGAMISEGECDAKQTCKLLGTWNDPVTKGPKTMRMITNWPSATTQIFEMYGPGPDGKEVKMMEITYTKK